MSGGDRSVSTPGEDTTGAVYDFPLRRDRQGYRPVYKLGNERGPCPYACKFCGVGRSEKVTDEWNIQRFNAKHAEYMGEIDGPYHPALFNRGNVSVEAEFSRGTLNHILGAFSQDSRVQYVSLNSREPAATVSVLDGLANDDWPFPIHFILGMESFSPRTAEVLGKQNAGEMARFVAKLKPYNLQKAVGQSSKPYVFGLDVNLVFLPELYFAEGEQRAWNEQRIGEGVSDDLRTLLNHIDPVVPCEVNIHPYYEVDSLPYKSANLNMLLRFLPELQRIVDTHNETGKRVQTSLFVGVVLFPATGANNEQRQRCEELQAAFDAFNSTGLTPE